MTDTPSLAPSTAASDTIDATLRRSASRFPDRVALTFADRRWTYAALDAAVDRVATLLAGHGLEDGARIAAYGVNSDAYLIAFLATSRAGYIHVPVNYALTGVSSSTCSPTRGPRSSWSTPPRRPLSRRSWATCPP